MFKYFNRKFAISEQAPPSDVKDAFSNFSDGGSSISADQLRRFLLEHQCEPDCTEDDSKRIIENALQSRKQDQENGDDGDGNSGSGEGLTVEEFFQFLFDEFNGPLKTQVCAFPFFFSFSFPRKCGKVEEKLFCFCFYFSFYLLFSLLLVHKK
jgi:phosphatidylinositol phospholipase C delta